MKKIKNKFAFICFALSAVLVLAAISIAAYTSLSSVKRVVSVKGTEQLFTSNILIPYLKENKIQTRIVSFAESDEKKNVELHISNFLQGDETKFDIYGIDYTLTIEVVDITGVRVTNSEIYSEYKIGGTALGENPYVTKGSLAGRGAHTDKYIIEIPDKYMSNYRLKITAIPSDAKYSSIGRVIATSTEIFTPHWSGRFLDTEESAVNNGEELGIINYQISGHIEETCTLSWDSSKVEIDPWFLVDMGANAGEVSTNGTRKEVKLDLGKDGTPDQYDIKFYRTLSVNDIEESWSEISDIETGYITFRNSVTGE